MSNTPCIYAPIVSLRDAPNSDSLQLAKVEGREWESIVRKGEYRIGDSALFIEPDSVVPDTEQFGFLKKKRVRATKIRGNVSYGLIVAPTPEQLQDILGAGCPSDVSDIVGVAHYEPQIHEGAIRNEDSIVPPFPDWGRFEVENIQKNPNLFDADELVYLSEKIHGQNVRLVCVNDVIYAGTRNLWWKPGTHPVWDAITPEIESFLREQSGILLYGERIPCQKGWDYGSAKNRIVFFAARELSNGMFMSPIDFRLPLDKVPSYGPVFYESAQRWIAAAQGESVLGAKYREGLVIQGMGRPGRFLKSVSPEYLANG